MGRIPRTPQRIISASRRTDLPGYFAEECAVRLRRLRTPIHSVFFWTRYPRAFQVPGRLQEVLQDIIENPFVHLTVTGLGGSRFEPHVPPTKEVLDQLEPLITTMHGQPERILWRYDPLLKDVMIRERFAQLAQAFTSVGIKSCTISFPAALSLKGPLDEQYKHAGLKSWTRMEKRAMALELVEVASRLGLDLYACAQPNIVEDTQGAIQPATCISAELAVRLHPHQYPLELPKDPGQRKHCQCVKSDDIGRYTDHCHSGCIYCYSSAGGPHWGPTDPAEG